MKIVRGHKPIDIFMPWRIGTTMLKSYYTSKVGLQKDSRYIKVYRGMIKYLINYALFLTHCDAYFHVNDD